MWEFDLFSSEFFLEIGKTFPIAGGFGEPFIVNPLEIKSVAAEGFGQFDRFPEDEIASEEFSSFGGIGSVVVVGDPVVG